MLVFVVESTGSLSFHQENREILTVLRILTGLQRAPSRAKSVDSYRASELDASVRPRWLERSPN